MRADKGSNTDTTRLAHCVDGTTAAAGEWAPTEMTEDNSKMRENRCQLMLRLRARLNCFAVPFLMSMGKEKNTVRKRHGDAGVRSVPDCCCFSTEYEKDVLFKRIPVISSINGNTTCDSPLEPSS